LRGAAWARGAPAKRPRGVRTILFDLDSTLLALRESAAVSTASILAVQVVRCGVPNTWKAIQAHAVMTSDTHSRGFI
jgi:predicted HAD superfamily phosphohydrolase YqeG